MHTWPGLHTCSMCSYHVRACLHSHTRIPVCVHIYMLVCIHTCLSESTHLCLHIHMPFHTFIFMPVCAHTCLSASTCMCLSMYSHMHACPSSHVWLSHAYPCAHTCMPVHACTHVCLPMLTCVPVLTHMCLSHARTHMSSSSATLTLHHQAPLTPGLAHKEHSGPSSMARDSGQLPAGVLRGGNGEVKASGHSG